MKRKIYAGTTSLSLGIFVQDTSSTTGGGLSGLTNSTSGLVAEYRRVGSSTWTAISLVSKTLGTYTSGGIVADGSLAGAYEIDLPNAAIASGVRAVYVRLYGAANMLPVLIEIELDAVNYQDADGLGLNRIDAAISSRLASASYTVPPTESAISSRIGTDIMDGVDDWPAAVGVIQNGLATSSVLSAVKVGTDRFLTMIVLDGAVYQFTANALELGPSSSGSTSVTVTPTQAALTYNEAVDGTLIQVYYNTDSDIAIGVVDAAGDAVTLTGKTLRFVVEDRFGNDVEVVENADITKSSNTATLTVSTTTTGTAGQYKWALRDVNNGNGRLGHGILEVIAIPDKDV